jgi:hypothetical protein
VKGTQKIDLEFLKLCIELKKQIFIAITHHITQNYYLVTNVLRKYPKNLQFIKNCSRILKVKYNRIKF